MGKTLSAGYRGAAHAHLTGRPGGVEGVGQKPKRTATRVRWDQPKRGRRGPSFEDQCWNFIRALRLWIRDGFRMATQEAYRERLAICRGCELWQGRARLGLGKCGHKSCGCTKGKLAVASQACPLGKWAAIPAPASARQG